MSATNRLFYHENELKNLDYYNSTNKKIFAFIPLIGVLYTRSVFNSFPPYHLPPFASSIDAREITRINIKLEKTRRDYLEVNLASSCLSIVLITCGIAMGFFSSLPLYCVAAGLYAFSSFVLYGAYMGMQECQSNISKSKSILAGMSH